MAQVEWSDSPLDADIWSDNAEDDFIWLPPSTFDGVGRWVARKMCHTFQANSNAYRFVAYKTTNQFTAIKE